MIIKLKWDKYFKTSGQYKRFINDFYIPFYNSYNFGNFSYQGLVRVVRLHNILTVGINTGRYFIQPDEDWYTVIGKVSDRLERIIRNSVPSSGLKLILLIQR